MRVISLGGLAACVTVIVSAPANAEPVVPAALVCQSLHAWRVQHSGTTAI